MQSIIIRTRSLETSTPPVSMFFLYATTKESSFQKIINFYKLRLINEIQKTKTRLGTYQSEL